LVRDQAQMPGSPNTTATISARAQIPEKRIRGSRGVAPIFSAEAIDGRTEAVIRAAFDMAGSNQINPTRNEVAPTAAKVQRTT
jgi:hypothetical protein